MVTKDEFGQLVADFEAFRDLMMEEVGKLTNRIEEIEEDIKDMKSNLKINPKKLR